MTKAELYAHPGWQWCTPEGARQQVLLAGLQSTLIEKLHWLEDAETLLLQMTTYQTPPSETAPDINPTSETIQHRTPDRNLWV